jgi:signal peptidase I
LDFALILVVLTAFAGVVWLVDMLLLAPRRRGAGRDGSALPEPAIVEYAKSFFPVLFIVLVLRSFLFEPFRIPSGSMMPTLLTGDFIFVNKFSYGLRLPVLNTKIVDIGEPDRGDVVVFRYPSDTSVNYIKRLVGLPGDVLDYEAVTKELRINGKPVENVYVGNYADQPSTDLLTETLGEVEHSILHRRDGFGSGGEYVVPEGHYFFMGDNRDNSQDSRYSDVGFVPEELIVGKAEVIWMSWRTFSEGGPRWGRIGKSIE